MRDKRLERAQLRCFWEAPFFAAGVSKLPVVWDDSIPTACTDGRQIRWNGKHFDSLKDSEIVTVLCHETAHCLLGHLWRCGGRDIELWNRSADFAVNDMLADFGALVKNKGFADPFPMPQGALVNNPAFKGMAEEEIYSAMVRQKPPGGSGGQKAPRQGNQPASGQGKGQGGGIGEFTAPAETADPSSSKKLANDWESTLLNSAKLAGDVPGSIKRLIGEIVAPSVPWWEILRNWLREQCADDYSWLKPNQFFDESGFILPSLQSEKIGAVVFGSDWSGSTQGELVTRFHAEKQSCLDELSPAKLVDIGFDTRVVFEREYLPGEKIDPEIQGGGGTCFKDLFRRCDEINPKCVVVLTDLEGSMPDVAPAYPVIWVVYGGQTKAPFGEVVQASCNP